MSSTAMSTHSSTFSPARSMHSTNSSPKMAYLSKSDDSSSEDEQLDAQAIYLQMRKDMAAKKAGIVNKTTESTAESEIEPEISVKQTSPQSSPKQAITTYARSKPMVERSPVQETAISHRSSPSRSSRRERTSMPSRRGSESSVTSSRGSASPGSRSVISDKQKTSQRPQATRKIVVPFLADESDADSDIDQPIKRTRVSKSSSSAKGPDLGSANHTDSARSTPDRTLGKDAFVEEKLEERFEHGNETGRPHSDIDELQEQEEREMDDKFTQQAKPTRKASKKAIEAMNRETQRMNRNMQLTHQAKVKQKHTVSDFLLRFNRGKTAQNNFVPLIAPLTAAATSSSVPTSSESVEQIDKETPPSSVPIEVDADQKESQYGYSAQPIDRQSDDEDLPDAGDVLTQQKVILPDTSMLTKRAGVDLSTISKTQKARLQPAAQSDLITLDDDDELEIVKNNLSVFDRVRPKATKQSRGHLIVRHLAALGMDSSTKRGKGSMTPDQLNAQLLRRARTQAQQERNEKIAALKAKGLVVLSAEEREREQETIENMLDKARLEAEELRKREKMAAKAEGGTELDAVASDDESEDGDYRGDSEEEEARPDEDDGDESDVDLSGSEDENMVESDHDEEQPRAAAVADPVNDEESSPGIFKSRRRTRHIIDDDDDDNDDDAMAATEQLTTSAGKDMQSQPVESQQHANSDLANAFGFAPQPTALMDASQMFAATMGGSPTQIDSQFHAQPADPYAEDSMDVFRELVPLTGITPSTYLQDSQMSAEASLNDASVHTPVRLVDTPMSAHTMGMSQIPTPSQDVGFGVRPPVARYDTAMSVDESVATPIAATPVPAARGRLHRRIASIADDDEDDEVVPSSVADIPIPNAFDALQKRTARADKQMYDKKQSKAKAMVDEQAEESEDEYAGLGGASDDESNADAADEADRALIDDESNVQVDENKIAAYYAEKARVDNEAQTSKLYKDIMSGALRKYRAGDGAFDLDSDDDDQEVERRRRRQREEARQRRLLLGDEQLGKFDGDVKKEAFLKAIEDRLDEDEGVDLLDGKDVNAEEAYESQEAEAQDSQPQAGGVLDAISGNAQKRKVNVIENDATTSTQPAQKRVNRRSYAESAFRKPASLDEVRQSVSFLIDEPDVMDHASDNEDEHHETSSANISHAAPTQSAPERAPYSARRTPAQPIVVDRLLQTRTSTNGPRNSLDSRSGTLLRSTTTTGTSNVPSLLRRATTNNQATNNMKPPPVPTLKHNSSSRDDGVRRGGSKKSSIHYAAREAERRALVDGIEKVRADKVRRLAKEMSGRESGRGLSALVGAAGGFE